MSTITIELPDDLAAQIDPATLPILLRELVVQKATRLHALEQSAKRPPPLYHEITDFLATSPTAEQIIAFKISAGAQARLEDLLDTHREASLSPEEKATLDIYCALNHVIIQLKARALRQQSLAR
jgi:hypothetical protein